MGNNYKRLIMKKQNKENPTTEALNPVNIYDFYPEDKQRFFVDSFRMLIPENLIKSFNIPETMLVSTEGEILEEFKKISGKLEIKTGKQSTATIYYLIHDYYFSGSRTRLFVILMSAKAAGKDYFNGINLDSILYVLETLKRQKIIILNDYTPETLNKITVKDVDICTNQIINAEQIKPLLVDLKHLLKVKTSQDLARGFKLTDSKKAQMLQVNRRAASTPQKPFFKIYNKTKEIAYKNENLFVEFPEIIHEQITAAAADYEKIKYRTHFKNINFSDVPELHILRYEFTLRNEQHLLKYGIKHNLIDFLETTQTTYFNAFKDIFLLMFNYDTEIKNMEIDNNLTPTDLIILEFIKIETEFAGTDILTGEVFNRIVEVGRNRFQKRRIAQKLRDLQFIARTSIKK